MTIQSNKLIFSFLTFITTLYASLSKIGCKLPEQQQMLLPETSKKYTSILKTKILLDLKHKTKTKLIITKELASISLDKEGKILGGKNISLLKNKKSTYLTCNNQELKKSTLWGIMKLIKL